MKKVGFTIGKFAPLHKGHQYLIETALKEMDEVYVIVYETDLIDIPVEKRAIGLKSYIQMLMLFLQKIHLASMEWMRRALRFKLII